MQRGKQLMGREDADVATAVTEIMRQDGIEVLLAAEPQRAEQSDSGEIQLAVRAPEGEHALVGSHLLVALGRPLNTDTLNLDAADVETEQRGFVKVNERLKTTAPGIYATGDVNYDPTGTYDITTDETFLRR